MIKLYRSMVHPERWVAYVQNTGWVMFPSTENGWEARQPARGLDPLYLREVPAHLAAKTGIPLPHPPGLAGPPSPDLLQMA